MWSFWSRDPTTSFPYDINESIAGHEEHSIWTLNRGKKKTNGELVSIFRYESKPGREDLVDVAKSSVKRLKTLRHPNILTFLDSLETERCVCFVTEDVIPINKYMESIREYTSDQKKFAVSWGLHQIAKGLAFLINDCNLNHNNIFSGSVYVQCSTGNWKIAGFDYVTSDNSYPDRKLGSLDKYKPESSNRSTKWSNDSWGLGCLIWEIFNGTLSTSQSLKSPGKIPKSLVPIYTELMNPNPNKRLNPLEFLEKCKSPNGFMKNPFIDAMLFLEEIQIKETSEKTRFFSSLDTQLDSFPIDICKNKILPQLVTAYEYGNAGAAILGPLFKIGKHLNDEEYQKRVVPCIIKLFGCKDRATRAKLLQQTELFVKYLNKNIVNDQIYPCVAQGFVDSNPTIREHTVKSMLHLAPKLNYNNLNDDLLKHFARLQARDEEAGIRTNTTVCLGKIASHLHPTIRQSVLIPAFLRSMRDPFSPARIAGILALSATQTYYSLRDTATKVMPALCHLTMDPEKSVRDQAFKALKGFISKIEKVSEDPSLSTQMEADLNTQGTEVSAALGASWASWAVSSLASKFYRSKTPTISSQDSGAKTSSSDDQKTTESSGNQPQTPSHTEPEEGDVWGKMEDLDEEDDHVCPADKNEWESETNLDLLDLDPVKKDSKIPLEPVKKSNSPVSINRERRSSLNGWDEDPFLESWTQKVEVKPSSVDITKSSSSAFQSKLQMTQRKNSMESNRDKSSLTSSEASKTSRFNQSSSSKPKKGPLRLGAQKIS